MTVTFKTHLDNYLPIAWPVLNYPPRKGEMVHAVPMSERYIKAKELFYELEVLSVTWFFDRAECQLGFSELQLKTIETLNLYKKHYNQ